MRFYRDVYSEDNYRVSVFFVLFKVYILFNILIQFSRQPYHFQNSNISLRFSLLVWKLSSDQMVKVLVKSGPGCWFTSWLALMSCSVALVSGGEDVDHDEGLLF